VHIVNTELWREITGERPPETPVTAREYKRHNLPGSSSTTSSCRRSTAAQKLRDVKSVRTLDQEKSSIALQDDASVEPVSSRLWMSLNGGVRDGKW
jgi:hypothetical protein